MGCEKKTGIKSDTKVGGRMELPLPKKEKTVGPTWQREDEDSDMISLNL